MLTNVLLAVICATVTDYVRLWRAEVR